MVGRILIFVISHVRRNYIIFGRNLFIANPMGVGDINYGSPIEASDLCIWSSRVQCSSLDGRNLDTV